MTENRLRLEVRDEWETEDEHDVDLHMELDMEVDTHLTGLAWVGIVGLIIGALLVTLGAFLFVMGYPDRWYGLNGDLDAARAHVRFVVTAMSVGSVGLFTGASLFFYGRRTTGAGRSRPVRMEAA